MMQPTWKTDDGLARVFPRRTRATPDDPMAFTEPPGLFPPTAAAVHVSVAFTYDLPRAEWLAKQWERIAPFRMMEQFWARHAKERRQQQRKLVGMET
jgi:hypothetical protein